MFVSLGGDKHRFRDPPRWFCFRLGGVDSREAMNVEWVRTEEKTAGSRSYVFGFAFLA